MKEELLGNLKCLECGNNSLLLEKNECWSLEIRSGRVVCSNCGTCHQIEDGIVNFLKNPSQDIIRERKAMDDEEYITDEDGKKYRITIDTIEKFKSKFLSFPEGDGSFFFRSGGSFQSIAEASGRFYSTLDYLALKGKEKILEIGACFSYASYKFAKKGCSVVAIDISNYLKVSNLFIKEAYFDRVFCDMHNMPFIDNTFDIVFGAAVLHHSKNLKRAFIEIHRVLKPKGRLVLINESARGMLERVHPVYKKMEKKGYGDTPYTIAQWKKSTRGGGFKKVKIDFLSLADDYITRHRNRGAELTGKLRLAYFFTKHRKIERLLLFLSMFPRFLFRPKSWRLICYK